MSGTFVTATRRAPFAQLGPVAIAKAPAFTTGNEFDTRTTAFVRLAVRFTGTAALSQLLLTWDFQQEEGVWLPATMRNTVIVLLSTIPAFAGAPGFLNDVQPVFLRFPAGVGLQTFDVADFATGGTRAIRFRATDVNPGAEAGGTLQLTLAEQLGL